MIDLSSYYFISEPIFSSLPRVEADALRRNITYTIVRKNNSIFEQGTYPKGVYFLEKGKVKLYQRTFNGGEQIISIHVDGELFGYRPLLCQEKYPASAMAIEECKIGFLPKREFHKTLEHSPRLATVLLKNLSAEFTVWVHAITNLGQRSAKERLLINLLVLMEKYRKKKKWPVEITLSRADLASLVGTSNETLARMIKVLKANRVITTKGRTIVIENQSQAQRMEDHLMI